MSKRVDWIQTYTGKKFTPLAPRAEDVCIEDIAHALSLKCRFCGHCRKFYSVAEHSFRVSAILPPPVRIFGLLHDAAEAYLADVARPIKSALHARIHAPAGGFSYGDNLPLIQFDEHGFEFLDIETRDKWSTKVETGLITFTTLENRILSAVCQAFGILDHTWWPAAVKQADDILLRTEARDLMGEPPESWQLDVPTLQETITPMSSDAIELIFIKAYRELTDKPAATECADVVARA